MFTTATFVGYVAGIWDAVLATIRIFLPSFIFFVALVRPHRGWMWSSPTFGTVLDGINARRA